MKMKSLFCLTFLLAAAFGLSAQSQVHAAGGHSSTADGSISFSVRHVSFVQDDQSEGIISEGTTHPFEIFVFQSTEEIAKTSLSYKVYPNPVTDYLELEILDGQFEGLTYVIMDMNGRTVAQNPLASQRETIDMQENPNGVYFLTVVSDSNEKFNTYKIVKH